MKTKGLLQPLVLAGVLATGFTVVWGVVSTWVLETGGHVVGADLPGGESLHFLTDGTPRVAHTDSPGGGRHFSDLEGHPVPSPENGSRWMAASVPLAASWAKAGNTSWDQRIRSFSDSGSPAVYWYFMGDGRPDGMGYFVGYDSESRARVGFLGKAGFCAGPLPPEELIPCGDTGGGPWGRVLCAQSQNTRHPDRDGGWRTRRDSISPWDVYVFGHDCKLYHADLQNRTLHVVLEEPRIRSAALISAVSDPAKGITVRLAARTDDAVLVFNERGQLLSRYPIPEPLRGREVHFAETTVGEAVMHWQSPFDSLATELEYRIYWVARDGHFRQAEGTLLWQGSGHELRVFGGVAAPTPLILGSLIATQRTGSLLAEGLASTYGEALGRALREYWPSLMIAHLLAAVFAVLCYRRQVRYGASGPERVIWPLFVFALGLPGWVGYRFCRSWPVLEPCPACDANVPQDRGECVRCEADFPGPALRGTEVFA